MKSGKVLVSLVLILILVLSAVPAMAAGDEASIGSTSYPTLEEAVEAVNNGSSASNIITLLENVEIENKLVIMKTLTIKGGDHTLTYNGTANTEEFPRAIDVVKESNGASLTIENLTIYCSAGYTERAINYNTTGSLTLNNVKVLRATNGNYPSYAINLPSSSSGATVTLTGGTYEGCIGLNIWGSNVTATATNTTFRSIDGADHEGYAVISLNAGAEGSKITVTGGLVEVAYLGNGEKKPTFIARNSTDTGKINGVENVARMVASISYGVHSYAFTSLQNAIDYAISDTLAGNVVELLANVNEEINISSDVTLNLNNHTVNNYIWLTTPNASLTAPAGLHVYSKVDGFMKEYANGVYQLTKGEEVVQPLSTPAVPSMPKTGDSSSITLWIALMAISAAAFVVLGKKARFN